MTEPPQTDRRLPPHVVVLVHGNNGAPSDMDAVERALRRRYGDRQLLVIKSRANSADTSLGVEVGGAKLAQEVVDAVLALELDPRVPRYRLSVVGHSLGGLYARYALAHITETLAMLDMDFVSFVTVCTPHLGSRRARGPSTIKNILRIGVHKVLATKKIYGQTGIDLLMDCPNAQAESTGYRFSFTASPPPERNVSPESSAVAPTRPLLEVMSDPDSEYIRALKKFKHGTLVAMTDGDVVVPFPSASIRSHSPYKSTFLTERFADWRWHIRHSGFTEHGGDSLEHTAFVERLNEHVDHSVEINPDEMGLDASTTPRFPSVEGYDCDNKQEVEFPHSMLCNQQQAMCWRRIDVTVEPSGVKGKLRLHDWPINKMQPPGCRADEFIDVLCEMIGVDHGMKPIPENCVEEGAEIEDPYSLFGPAREHSDKTSVHGMSASSSTPATSDSGSAASDAENADYPAIEV